MNITSKNRVSDSNHNKQQNKIPHIERLLRQGLAEGLIRNPRQDNGAAIRSVRNSLTRMWMGQAEDQRSPFFKVAPRGVIAKGFLPLMEKAFKASRLSKDVLDLLMTVEHEQMAKMGSKSLHLGWSHDGPEKVRAVFSDKVRKSEIDEHVLQCAMKRVMEHGPTANISEISYEDAIQTPASGDDDEDVEAMDMTTSSGPIDFVSGWFPKSSFTGKKLERAQRAWDYIQARLKDIDKAYAAGKSVIFGALAGTRLVESGPDWTKKKKKRFISALEKAEAIKARSIILPLQRNMKFRTIKGTRIRPWAAWNDIPVVDDTVQAIMELADSKGLPVLSGDWSGFDASIPPWLFEYAAEILVAWAPKSKWIRQHVKSLTYGVKLIAPDKIYPPQPSSMKSGSGMTNFLDGVINMLVLYYGVCNGDYEIDAITVQGDDFLLVGKGITPEAISINAARFGMEANASKQLYTTGKAQYLQRVHVLGMPGGMFPTMRVLAGILGYERMKYASKDWNGWSEILRAISQLENAAFNPAFEALVNYVSSGDRHKLGRDMPPQEVLNAATAAGRNVARQGGTYASMARISEGEWAKNATNGVLRKEGALPPVGSQARFSRVYGDRVNSITSTS